MVQVLSAPWKPKCREGEHLLKNWATEHWNWHAVVVIVEEEVKRSEGISPVETLYIGGKHMGVYEGDEGEWI